MSPDPDARRRVVKSIGPAGLASLYADLLLTDRLVRNFTGPDYCNCPIAHAEPENGHNPVPA